MEEKYEIYVVVQFQFESVHCWPGCDIEEMWFLKEPHRHMFHTKATKRVKHTNRDVEIITLKRAMEAWAKERYGLDQKDCILSSCEDMAIAFLEEFDLEQCEVLEDGENGGLVKRTR